MVVSTRKIKPLGNNKNLICSKKQKSFSILEQYGLTEVSLFPNCLNTNATSGQVRQTRLTEQLYIIEFFKDNSPNELSQLVYVLEAKTHNYTCIIHLVTED